MTKTQKLELELAELEAQHKKVRALLKAIGDAMWELLADRVTDLAHDVANEAARNALDDHEAIANHGD